MACGILFAEGYDILDTNFRTKGGEIDIICEKGRDIWFVEVKTRTGDRMGEPIEAVDRNKVNRMRRAAVRYVSQNRCYDRDIRFKVLEVLVRETDDIC